MVKFIFTKRSLGELLPHLNFSSLSQGKLTIYFCLQDSNFEGLHWFDSVWKHINDERKQLQEQQHKGSVQLQQALALTEKKIKTLEEEFKLLYYSLTSARIFFR